MLEVGLLVGVGALALALRLPYLQLIPAFTDEVEDVYWGFLISQGQLAPLVGTSSYIGSFWNWLVAGAFWLSGNSLHAPRALILALGVLTVLATHPLGRAWGGPVAGLLAAGLLATAGGHIVVNSHVAWSNCATPLFSTLGVWALYRATGPNPPTPLPGAGRGATPWLSPTSHGSPFACGEGRRGMKLALAGLCWGLAFQTHPSVLALLPGAALFLLWKGRPLLRTRWPYLAAGLFVLVNLNLVVYNLTSGFESLAYGLKVSSTYSLDPQLTPAVYLKRLGELGMGLLQGLAGAVDERSRDADYLLDPGLWPIALAAAAGLLLLLRRGNPLPALLLASTWLVLPLFNGKYEILLNGRYLAPLLPVLYACCGALLATGLARLPDGRAWRGRAAVGLGALFLVAHPLVYLVTYYRQAPKVAHTNAPIWETVEQVVAARRADEVVVIDRPLQDKKLGLASGKLASVFRLALAVHGVPTRLASAAGDELLDPSLRCRDQLLILASRRPDQNDAILSRLDLRDLNRGPAGGPTQPSMFYGLYRLERLPGARPDCLRRPDTP